MASNYPGSLDSFDTIASDKKTSDAVGGRTHRAMHNDLGDAIEAIETELGVNPSGSDATVAARLSAIEAGTNLATGAVTSAKIADGTIVNADISASAAIDSSKIVFGAATHTSGTGSPEGVVTATPGSTWLQTDATTDVKGWIRWVKATGTGNTGWQAGPEADTGDRLITSLTPLNSWTLGGSTYCRMRRVGNVVHLNIVLDSTSATDAAALTLPSGFGPSHLSTAIAKAGSSTDNNISQADVNDGTIYIYGYSTHRTTFTIGTSYVTKEAWPSALPGSAA